MPISLKKSDALLIVDLQNDFLPGGSLAVQDGDEIIPAVNTYISRFTRQNLPVFASRDYHPKDHCSFTEQGGTWPPHCVSGTRGASFAEALHLPEKAIIISKATSQDRDAYSALDGTKLKEKLLSLKVQRVFVCGLATDYCVYASVKDLLKEKFDTVLLIDGIKGVNLNLGDSEEAVRKMTDLGASQLTIEGLAE